MSDTAQFEGFVRDYQDMVFSTAMRLLANPTEAEDISQEVFLKAYARWDELRHSPTVGGWLKTVATNLSLNHLSRYRARWKFFSDLHGGSDNLVAGNHWENPAAPLVSRLMQVRMTNTAVLDPNQHILRADFTA